VEDGGDRWIRIVGVDGQQFQNSKKGKVSSGIPSCGVSMSLVNFTFFFLKPKKTPFPFLILRN
jgi:hypothetical protein